MSGKTYPMNGGEILTETEKMKASFCTLGCRVNQYESDAIAEELEKNGFVIVPFGEKCDVAVINTCSVTAESDRKSRQLIRKAINGGCAGKVVVTGCSAQIFPDEILKIEGVDAVLGNGEKETAAKSIISLLNGDDIPREQIGNIAEAPYDTLTISKARRARAYVKIEDGCENKCAYCIIPEGRGKVRSKPESVIIDEVKKIARSCPEIILTGIETASYGRDRGERDALASLLEKVDSVDGIDRLTLGSLDPNVLTDAFLERVSSLKGFLPHLHLSIQSGSSGTLARMRRKYNAEKALERIEKTKEIIKGITLSADVIVGFPGETDEEFAETVEFCRKVRFMHLHIFPYSKRAGTEAAALPCQVPENVKHERARILAGIQSEIKKELLEEYVETYRDGGDEVLFEQKLKGYNIGHTRHYVEVRVKSDCDFSDRVAPVTLTHTDGKVCFGTTEV